MQTPSNDAKLNRRIYIGTSVAALIFLASMALAIGWKFLAFIALVLLEPLCYWAWSRRDNGRLS